jgi:GNAT superfamily N-acetyltransferase
MHKYVLIKVEVNMEVEIKINGDLESEQIIELYLANKWSSAEKPIQLIAALENSHTVVTAYNNKNLIGLANSLSDGHLVVYYSHLLVHPDFQGLGVGRKIMAAMSSIYSEFHQQILVADGRAIDFYSSVGFERA